MTPSTSEVVPLEKMEKRVFVMNWSESSKIGYLYVVQGWFSPEGSDKHRRRFLGRTVNLAHPAYNQSGDAMDESTLVKRAQAGDRDAIQSLWRDNRRWVAAIILIHRPRTVEVDDLMQDVAIKLLAKVHTLRDPEAFKPWLRQIIINICRGAARSERPHLRLADPAGARSQDDDHGSLAEPRGELPEPGELLGQQDAAARLLRQAMSLPADYREPLLLRCLQSLTYQQISDILELPVTTVETRLARARRMLREEVGEELRDDQ